VGSFTVSLENTKVRSFTGVIVVDVGKTQTGIDGVAAGIEHQGGRRRHE
jgi:hypothetical protein